MHACREQLEMVYPHFVQVEEKEEGRKLGQVGEAIERRIQMLESVGVGEGEEEEGNDKDGGNGKDKNKGKCMVRYQLP